MKKIPFANNIKYILAVIPFIWLFFIIDFQKLELIFKNTAPWTIPLILIANLIVFILQGSRWWMLIHSFIPTVSYMKAMKYHFIGLFYSIVLPSSAAQDVVRSVLISRDESYSTIWASSWIARMTGMLSLFIMSLFGFVQYEAIRNIENLPLLITLLILGIVLLVLFSFSKTITRPFRLIFQKILPAKIFDVISLIRNSIYLFKHKGFVLFNVLSLTILAHIILFASLTLIVYGITGELKIKEMFAFAPIIEFICMMLPITPNGMGIREVLSLKMFEYMGFSNEELTIYVAIIFISIIFRLIGVIPILGQKREIKVKDFT